MKKRFKVFESEFGVRWGTAICICGWSPEFFRRYLNLMCDCGHVTIIEKRKARNFKCPACTPPKPELNLSQTSSYNVWGGMMRRCFNPKDKKFPIYGGRGITVCEKWQAFQGFYEDMGERPEGMSLDRINNDGDYEPTNCRWATPTEQAQNRSNNVNITIGGETYCLSEWSRRSGLSRHILQRRVRNGWSPEDILKPSSYGSRKCQNS